MHAGLPTRDQVEPLRLETNQLTAIIATSRISALRNPIANRKSQI
jgi:hypothetical protein